MFNLCLDWKMLVKSEQERSKIHGREENAAHAVTKGEIAGLREVARDCFKNWSQDQL